MGNFDFSFTPESSIWTSNSFNTQAVLLRSIRLVRGRAISPRSLPRHPCARPTPAPGAMPGRTIRDLQEQKWRFGVYSSKLGCKNAIPAIPRGPVGEPHSSVRCPILHRRICLGGIVVGLVSRLLIAEQIWDTLVPNRGLHGISDADRAWFMFGAIGPAIGDFIPSGAPPAGAPAGATGPRSPYYSVWQNAFELAVGNPAKKLPDLVSTITTLQQGIDQLATIVANHDFGAARAFQQSSLPGIQTASNDLNTTGVGGT